MTWTFGDLKLSIFVFSKEMQIPIVTIILYSVFTPTCEAVDISMHGSNRNTQIHETTRR